MDLLGYLLFEAVFYYGLGYWTGWVVLRLVGATAAPLDNHAMPDISLLHLLFGDQRPFYYADGMCYVQRNLVVLTGWASWAVFCFLGWRLIILSR